MIHLPPVFPRTVALGLLGAGAFCGVQAYSISTHAAENQKTATVETNTYARAQKIGKPCIEILRGGVDNDGTLSLESDEDKSKYVAACGKIAVARVEHMKDLIGNEQSLQTDEGNVLRFASLGGILAVAGGAIYVKGGNGFNFQP